MGGQALCMDQYHKILAACRVPGVRRDSLEIYPPNKPDAPKHIIVAHKNHVSYVSVNMEGKREGGRERRYEIVSYTDFIAFVPPNKKVCEQGCKTTILND